MKELKRKYKTSFSFFGVGDSRRLKRGLRKLAFFSVIELITCPFFIFQANYELSLPICHFLNRSLYELSEYIIVVTV